MTRALAAALFLAALAAAGGAVARSTAAQPGVSTAAPAAGEAAAKPPDGTLPAPRADAVQRQDAAQRQAELAAIRAEIARLEGLLDAARRHESGLEGEVAAAGLELQLEEKRLAEAVTAEAEVARRAAVSEQEVRGLEVALAASRRDFRRRLTGLYRLGRQGYLRLLFLLQPDERLLPSIRLVRYLARRDRVAIDRYQEAARHLAAERDRLLAERRADRDWREREELRRRRLVSARQRKAALLVRAARERSELAMRAGELAAKERKLAAFLDLLYGQSDAAGLAGSPMQGFRGVLDWPVKGRVTERFGPQLDPRYHTQVPHNGIDLATAPRSEVKAVFPGKVLFAAPFEGYGPTVVILHPGRVFTLYAGLSELRAGKEDMVSLGDVVGLASERLYFEIRVENRPDDPLSWLR